ncbi:MAG: hypothetical protein KDA25_11440 [Phycisphaerales bacterium]|nr:hypothetical protein [Phycisphaerales bacterium]
MLHPPTIQRLLPLVSGLVGVVAGLFVALPAAAQPSFSGGPMPSATDLVPVAVMTDVERVGPGETFHVIVTFDVEPMWHIYWAFPGDSGMATEINLKMPAGFVAAPIRWPRPETITSSQGTTYGFGGRTALAVPVTAPAVLEDGRAEIAADIAWLVCKEACLLGSADKTLSIVTTSTPTAPGDRVMSDASRKAMDRLSRPVGKSTQSAATFDGTTLVVTGPMPTVESPEVTLRGVPQPGIEFGDATSEIADGRFTVRVPVMLDREASLGKPLVLTGQVLLGRRHRDPSYEFRIDATASADPATRRSQ